jgi:SAM-dependent methyltransferase
MTSNPIKAAPVASWLASALYLRSAGMDAMHKLVRQRRRTRSQVQSDYDGGEWKDFLRERSWERSSSLEDFVFRPESTPLRAMVDGRLVEISSRDYYRYRTQQLCQLLGEFDMGRERLVEVGCGSGRNLFAAASSGRWKELRGLDLSPTGVQVVREVASHFGLAGVSAGPIDLLDESSPGFAELRGATCFTFYCLEQLPSYTEAVLRRLAAAGVRRVIHIEPTMEFFNAASVRDLASIAYIWRQNYLADLVETARRLEQQGTIRIVATRRLGFAPTLRNTPTLVVWEPLAKSA